MDRDGRDVSNEGKRLCKCRVSRVQLAGMIVHETGNGCSFIVVKQRPHLLISLCLLCNTGLSSTAMPPPLPAALGVCFLAGTVLIWRDISSKKKGETRTFSSLLSHYVAVKAVGWLGRRQRQKLEADTLNVKEVQEETLLKRLRKNANTCYGKQYDFSSIHGKKKSDEGQL